MCFEGEGDWSLNAFLGIEKPKTQLTYTSKNWNDGKLTYKNWGYKKYNGSLFLCRRKLALLRLGSRRRRLNEAFRLSSKINKLLITHLSLPELFYLLFPPLGITQPLAPTPNHIPILSHFLIFSSVHIKFFGIKLFTHVIYCYLKIK